MGDEGRDRRGLPGDDGWNPTSLSAAAVDLQSAYRRPSELGDLAVVVQLSKMR